MSVLELKSFRAPTMPEALAEVRRAFGPDAVILHTRQISRRGLVGVRQHGVEVTASRGTPQPPLPAEKLQPRGGAAAQPPIASLRKQLDFLTEMVDEVYRRQEPSTTCDGRPRPSGPPITSWDGLPRPSSESPEVEASDPLRQRLVRLEFPARLISELMYSVRPPERAGQELGRPEKADPQAAARLIAELAGRIRTADCEETQFARRTVAAFVGPTGCGKTLTIAKLAAVAKIDHGKQVALATTDCFRFAAARELQAFAEILDVPCAVAGTPQELRNFLTQSHDADVILIDTAGQSPADAQRMAELAAFLSAEVQVQLVLAANLRDSLIENALDRYRMLNYQRLILTKLDETSATGVIGRVAELSNAPVSFVTTGQTVPDDLEPAEARWLAEFALGYRRLRSGPQNEMNEIGG